MRIVTYDIETLANLYLYYDYENKTGDENVFIIHESRNDLVAFYNYIQAKGIGQVGLNNLSFDAQVDQWIIDNYHTLKHLSGEECARRIYTYAQHVINKQNSGDWLDYPEWKIKTPQVDLFKIWHFDNRAKMTGLKWIQFSIDWPNLLEMPIDHREDVTADQIDEILQYCKNDVMSTNKFYQITLGNTTHPLYKGINKIALRSDIEKQFGLKCLNFNDVKIGDEINKMLYMKATGLTKEDLKNRKTTIKPFTYGDCVPSYVTFKTPQMKSFLENIKGTYVSIEKEKQEFPLHFRGTLYMIAKGGIHSSDKKRILRAGPNQILRDADIGSQYPNAIRKRKLYPRHLGVEWLDGYVGNIYTRMDAKKRYKTSKVSGDKAIDEAFKLALNGGGFGKTGEPTSWQYDPFVSMSVTIGNQFEILMLIEMLEEEGIHIESANTDGIVCLFDKRLEDKYNEICIAWEKIVGNHELGQLEYTEYEMLTQTNVNSYIAIKPGTEPIEKRVKTKSEFTVDFEIHKNKSSRVVPMALFEYYVHGRSPEEFIRNHRNIYDFCNGVKKKGEWFFISERVIMGDHIETPEQKTLRYYVSNRGCKITKRHKDGRQIQVEAGKWMQTIFNLYVEKPWEEYDINYDYYIEKAYNIIESIDKKVIEEKQETQLELFF